MIIACQAVPLVEGVWGRPLSESILYGRPYRMEGDRKVFSPLLNQAARQYVKDVLASFAFFPPSSYSSSLLLLNNPLFSLPSTKGAHKSDLISMFQVNIHCAPFCMLLIAIKCGHSKNKPCLQNLCTYRNGIEEISDTVVFV